MMKDLGITCKKRPFFTKERDEKKMNELREAIKNEKENNIVCIDESGIKKYIEK